MRIKELAARCQVPVDTIRHYEKAGLLGRPARSANGYRRYTEADAERLVLVRNCRSLDMSHDEVRELLAFIDHPAPDCGAVDRVVAAHLEHVRNRLDALKRLEQQLGGLLASCGSARTGEGCAIVAALAADGERGVPVAPGETGTHGGPRRSH
ncbi:Cd(II)/Pb(II)-responsive transcriptional regulator [Rivibacter subsaxonicus]|uniref:MerR family transcriptional regulator n=1 Tax=Rivibacter subsaxonicus TaxID=457575 RepID=A0A4Q7VMS1_9BURK|nr:Cd(II)/Pb(II)-responsive transcriptional regulator [Rivibacter subsaxonicus]RZT97623.1 MerR family transcriptional regulator [Rivibacter subsaxonicus]